MKLEQALQETGMAEAYYDGYTAVVREDEDESGIPEYRITIQIGRMPPHFSGGYKTLDAVEAEMASTHAPQPIEWTPVETD